MRVARGQLEAERTAGSDFSRGFLLTDLVGIRAIETTVAADRQAKELRPGTRCCLNRLLIRRWKRPRLIPKLTAKQIAAQVDSA